MAVKSSEVRVDHVETRAHVPPHRIRATRGWGQLGLGEVWRYRELLWFTIWRNVKANYRQMALGPLWIVIQPLINMVVFSVIFGRLARLPSDGVPYPIFTYTALLPWGYFANSVRASVGSLVTQMNIISKVYFPRLIVPLSAVLFGLIDLAISFVILLVMMAFYGFDYSWTMLTLPLYVLFAAATALCVGLWTSAIAVRFRDIQLGAQYGLQVWMYATPVAYSASLVPEQWLWLYQLNPMYWVIEGFRWAVLGTGQGPAPYMLVPVTGVVLLLVLGAYVFRRTERTIVDLL